MRGSLGILHPCLQSVVEVIHIIPISNVWPERGASRIKLVKSRLRSSMKNDLLNFILHININGPDLFTKECESLIRRCVVAWHDTKRRKKSKGTGFPPKSVDDHHVRPQVSVVDAGTQTEEEMQAEKEQEAAVLQAFNISSSNIQVESCDDSDSGLDDDFDDEDFF